MHLALHAAQGIFQRVFGGVDGTQHRVGQGAPGLQAAHAVIEQRWQLFDHALEPALVTPVDIQAQQQGRQQQQSDQTRPAATDEAEQTTQAPQRQPRTQAFRGAAETGA
ncbi:hypothetical protein D3C80_1456270 [compost metagenome]